jgi:cytochrome c-type biogenesis protein CcmH/NrfG
VNALAIKPAPPLAMPPVVEADTSKKAKTCEEIVGPSWALLGSNQPGRALGEIGLGRRALMLGKLDDAQMCFCRAAVLDTTKPEAFLALIRVLLSKRDVVQAREWAERAARENPGNPDVQALYGDALARTGDIDRARALWLATGHIEPSDVSSTRVLAYNFIRGAERSVRSADPAQGERLFRRAVLLDPLNATGAAGLGRVLMSQGEYQGAREWIKRAVALEPRDVELRILFGDVLHKNGDDAAATAEWKTATELDPHNFKAAGRILKYGN